MAELCFQLDFNHSGWKEATEDAMEDFEVGKDSQEAPYLKASIFRNNEAMWVGFNAKDYSEGVACRLHTSC